jgi:hypothetical protein
MHIISNASGKGKNAYRQHSEDFKSLVSITEIMHSTQDSQGTIFAVALSQMHNISNATWYISHEIVI